MPFKRLFGLSKRAPVKRNSNPSDGVTRVKMSVGREPLAELHHVRSMLAADLDLTPRQRNDLKKRRIELERMLK